VIERAFKVSKPGRQRTAAATAPTKENRTYCSKPVEPGDADGHREGGPAYQMEKR
jgi:hypothetical protein